VSQMISICIITCDRTVLLKQAIDSCTAQTLLPGEIVIGDDSKSDETEAMIKILSTQTEIPIAYKRNTPRLGQNGNVNSVFLRASGTHLVLLHDDDTLTPNALEDLFTCWNAHADLTAAYGKQYVMSHDGIRDSEASVSLNNLYYRSPLNAGLQPHPWMVGLTQQFPNDGYMILASAAKETLWRSREEFGYGAEFEFGLRLGLRYSKFYFLDAYTANYRLTQGTSITHSSSDDASLQAYRIVRSVELPPEAEALRSKRLKDLAPLATLQAVRQGMKQEAWAIYYSANFSWRKRLTLGGIRTLLLLINPFKG
jgi:GT2 family glycosyltransferase